MDKIECPVCHNLINNDSNFCTYCGLNLQEYAEQHKEIKEELKIEAQSKVSEQDIIDEIKELVIDAEGNRYAVIKQVKEEYGVSTDHAAQLVNEAMKALEGESVQPVKNIPNTTPIVEAKQPEKNVKVIYLPDDKVNKLKSTKVPTAVIKIIDIIRYLVGLAVILIGSAGIADKIVPAILFIIFGISWFPFIYRKFKFSTAMNFIIPCIAFIVFFIAVGVSS